MAFVKIFNQLLDNVSITKFQQIYDDKAGSHDLKVIAVISEFLELRPLNDIVTHH